jgi:hypothetical protein
VPVSIEQLGKLTQDKPKFRDVPVPAFGGDVRLRRMTAAEYITVQAMLGSARQSVETLSAVGGKMSVGQIAFDIVVATAVDETGKPLFAGERLQILADNPDIGVSLGMAAMEFNGLIGEASAPKNEPSTPVPNSE